MGVRLAVGVERGGAACGDERVIGDDVVEARGSAWWTISDGSALSATSASDDLHVEATALQQRAGSRRSRCARARAGSGRASRRPRGAAARSGSSAASGQPGSTRIEQPRRHPVRNDGHELDEAPRVRRRGARRARARRSSPTAAARSRCASRGAR